MLLRSAVLFFLLLALAGTVILSSSGAATTIFLADTSDSSENSRQEIEEFIRDALKTKDISDNAGIVSFGLNTAVENSPSGSPVFNKLQTNVNGSFTNIESGLKSAAALIPAGQRKRIVLITDGIENAGNALKQAKLLRQNGITLDIHPIAADAVPDALIRSLDIPSALHINESFEVVVEIYSNVETDATLRFYEGRNLDSTRAVTLKRGINRFAYSEKAEEGGFVTYRAEVWFEGDGVSENNYLSAYSYVSDIPKVLLVSEKELEDNELWKILNDDLNIELSKPEAVPVQLTELQKYDAFILNDVYADALSPDFLSGLKIMVENQGKGLLTTGGDNSYAIGGYNNTELEEILPVNMEIIPKEEDPNLGLVLVIDKSGSMGGGSYGVTKLDLAKEAAIRACEVLTSRDSIGVIAFDDAVQWVVKTGRVDDKEKVNELIATIRPGGGTSILPPLKEAYNSLRDTDTKLKHIILLTDGQAEKTGYDEVIENIRMDGITLSTVAVGSGADMQLLSALAEGGKGRYYSTEKFTDIPKIIAKETFLAGKTYVNNRTFAPKLTGFSEILSGINAVPYLDGYIGTTRKQTANVIFSSDTDDPILATWQYGLGRTAVWTSDADGMWTNSWLAWEQYPKFWKNVVSWILQQHAAGEYTLEASLDEGRGNVKLTLPSGETYQGSAEARITSPEGNV
ncbi:MAG: VWA domain-containing protein, partial [Eubacteriales bacterium]|nr:VWA domain-containing protein [Eubacteriales bacterium]